MGKPCTPTPPALFINGNSSLGKTAVVKAILSTVLGDRNPSRYAFLDCVECHTSRLIFEHAVYQFRNAPQRTKSSLSAAHDLNRDTQQNSSSPSQTANTDMISSSMATEPTRSRGKRNMITDTESKKRKRKVVHEDNFVWDKCENINEFVEWCRKICDEDSEGDSDGKNIIQQDHQNPRAQQETRYLVLDRADRLRDTAPNLIPVLMRLQELTRRNMCVILISTIVWEKFRSKTGGYEPVIVNFPQYSKD
ncbi:Origin recognition complex subunit 5, partial [Modicella reniformis]